MTSKAPHDALMDLVVDHYVPIVDELEEENWPGNLPRVGREREQAPALPAPSAFGGLRPRTTEVRFSQAAADSAYVHVRKLTADAPAAKAEAHVPRPVRIVGVRGC